MKFTRHFSKTRKHHTSSAGGKGAALGEMTYAGMPIPEGFTVLTGAFDHFLVKNRLDEKLRSILQEARDKQDDRSIRRASDKARKLIVRAVVPIRIRTQIRQSFKELEAQHVAVRSSAIAEDGVEASWAGQLETYLNTTQKYLIENIKKCWLSLFSSHALSYQLRNEHGDKVSVAVVVQKMVQSECSGVAFSVHPVTNNRKHILIEAGFGLGEAVVAGLVTPDSYVVERATRKVVKRQISIQTRALVRSYRGIGNQWKRLKKSEGESAVLTDVQLVELAGLVLGIERHLGFPCDVEWAYERGRFYITQSRPITTQR